MEARATRPTVRPTAWPVLRDEPLDCWAWLLGGAVGGAVGVMVIVRSTPVTVSTDVMGVGVHVMVESVVEPAEGALVMVVEAYGDMSALNQAWML